MGHDVDHPLLHQRGQADGRAGVVGKDQERACVGNDPAVQRHAVHRRRHAVLANAVVDVVRCEVIRGDSAMVAGLGVVRAGQVGRAAEHGRHGRDQRFEHFARAGTGGEGRLIADRDLFDRFQRLAGGIGQRACVHGVELVGLRGCCQT